MDPPLYLRPDVAVEPLLFDWYAAPYLIAPASAATQIAFHQLPILESFVANPGRHAALLRYPAMRGGPFIATDPANVGAVRELLERTRTEQAHMIELAHAIRELEALLEAQAHGDSLEPLYARIPAPLRGFVELVYDVRNHASIRFIEPLLYRSRYWQPSAQALRFRVVGEHRPFLQSTPHLTGDAAVVRTPFTSAQVDALLAMREAPRPLGELGELGLAPRELEPLFTPQAPPPRAAPPERVRVRYFGHASVLFESSRCSVLFDPSFAYATAAATDRFTLHDLPARIDYVVLTHAHLDHCMLESLLALRYKVRHVVVPRSGGGTLIDPSLRLMLEHVGFRSVIELDELQALELDGGELRALPFLGEHCDLAIRTKCSYQVRFGDRSAVLLADSNNLEPALYEHLAEVIGPLDLMFLGMECDGAPMSWLYGPFLPSSLSREHDQARRLNGSDAAKADAIIDRLRPRRVRIYAMGQEPWLGHVMVVHYTPESRPIVESDRTIARCREAGIEAARSYLQEELWL